MTGKPWPPEGEGWPPCMTIAELSRALAGMTVAGGVPLHPSHRIMIRIGDQVWPLAGVSATFYRGQFTGVLEAGGEIT